MGNSNGKITAPISLHGDVYPVLGIAPSGAMYDVAEACTSGKIKGGQRNKPTQGGTQGLVLASTSADPSPSDMLWSIKPTYVCASNLIGYFVRYYATNSNNWKYYPPVEGTDWMRLLDFENYNHNAPQPSNMFTAGASVESAPLNSYGQPSGKFNLFKGHIFKSFIEILSSTGFRIDEFFQHRPNLRFVVEVYNTYIYDSSGNKVYWYTAPDDYLIAKYCFGTMSSLTLRGDFDINLYDLVTELGIPTKSLGSSGYPVTFVYGLQEVTSAQTTAAQAVSGKLNGIPSTGITINGYRTFNGGQMHEYSFTIDNEWEGEIEDVQYGFIQRGSGTSIQWKDSPATSEGLYEVYTNWADTDNQSLVKDGANLFMKITIRNTSTSTDAENNTLTFTNSIASDGIKLAVIRRNHPNRDVMPVRFFPTADYITYNGASSSVREMSSFSVAPNESKTVYLLIENFFTNTLGGLSESLEKLYWNSARIVWTRYEGSSLPSESEYPDADNTLTWASGTVSDDLFDMGTYIET